MRLYIYIIWEIVVLCPSGDVQIRRKRKLVLISVMSVCPLMTTATILSFISWNLTQSPHCSLIFYVLSLKIWNISIFSDASTAGIIIYHKKIPICIAPWQNENYGQYLILVFFVHRFFAFMTSSDIKFIIFIEKWKLYYESWLQAMNLKTCNYFFLFLFDPLSG